eukprot:345065-Pyramimonas_sp.AAC.2
MSCSQSFSSPSPCSQSLSPRAHDAPPALYISRVCNARSSIANAASHVQRERALARARDGARACAPTHTHTALHVCAVAESSASSS